MYIARHHAEWLALLGISVPFLSMPVLLWAFPQGLNESDLDLIRTPRLTYDEWLDDLVSSAFDPALHHAWVYWMLDVMLKMPDEYIQTDSAISVPIPEYGETFRPDFAIAEAQRAAFFNAEARRRRGFSMNVCVRDDEGKKAWVSCSQQESDCPLEHSLVMNQEIHLAAVPTDIQSDIARAVAILKEGRCTAVFLFGSGAAGTLTDRSDIDLAVQGCPPEAFFRLLGRLLYELERSVDLVDLDAPDPFSQMLLREGGLQRVG